MSYLYPTQLADSSRRASSRRGWGTTIVGIGIGTIVIAAFDGWLVLPLVLGAIAMLIGLLVMFSAEMVIRNALTTAAVDVAGNFVDVSFDQSWWPIIIDYYRQAQAAVKKSDMGLDDAFESLFGQYLDKRGYKPRY